MMTLLSTSPPLHSVGSVLTALRLAVDLYGDRDAPRAAAGVPLIHPDGLEIRAWRDEATDEVVIELHPCSATAEVIDDDA